MNDDRRSHSSPRARAVPGAAVDAVLARADDLAKRWAIALILGRPLGQIGEIPLADLALEAPALCARVVRALGSDSELAPIAGEDATGGLADSARAPAVGALAGARDGPAVVDAVEALRGVVWEALHEELRWPTASLPADGPGLSAARQLSDLADRLAYVCAKLLARELAGVLVRAPARLSPYGEPTLGGQAPEPSARASAGTGHAVIVDERDGLAPPPAAAASSRSPASDAPPSSPSAPASRARPLPWDTPTPPDVRVKRAEEPAAPVDESA